MNAEASDAIGYLRLNERLSTSGQPTTEELQAMARGGVEVVINLALHNDPRYSLPDEEGAVRTAGMIYVHIPVIFNAPTEENLISFFASMESHVGKNVHVHCAANKRVTAFVGLYRVLVQHWDEESAFDPMRQIWDPNAIWTAFIESMLMKKYCNKRQILKPSN